MHNSPLNNIKARYLEVLIKGDRSGAERVIEEALAADFLPTRLYLEVLLPVQMEIGERWHEGKVSIAQEHVATQITLDIMSRLRSILKSRTKLGLRAAVMSVIGDSHTVGAQAVADFLAMDGWEVDFLGGNTPTDEAARYVAERGSSLVCISVSMEGSIPEGAKLVEKLKKITPTPKIIVGGHSLIQKPGLVEKVGGDAFAKTPHDAVIMGRQLCGLLSSENALAIYLRKLGQSVHEYRKLRGLSQQELAGSAGLDRAYISSVEHGKQNISIGAISKLAGALGITIEELLTRF